MNATTLAALAQPTRLRIVELLRNRPASVNGIADQLGLSQPQTSKHLRVLSNAGLVEALPAANRRIYSLRSEPFDQLAQWVETFQSQQDERYAQLDAYLAEPDDGK